MANNFSKRTNTEFVKWEEFYPYVRPMAQDCPISIVDAAIRAACIEFCSKSLIWNVETICGDMTAGERVYKYNNKNDQISNVMPICCIIRDVRVGDKPEDHFAYPTNLQDLDYYEPNWRLSEAPFPKRFYMKDPNTIVFVENPTETVPHGIHLCVLLNLTEKQKVLRNLFFKTGRKRLPVVLFTEYTAWQAECGLTPASFSFTTVNFVQVSPEQKVKCTSHT